MQRQKGNNRPNNDEVKLVGRSCLVNENMCIALAYNFSMEWCSLGSGE